MKVDNPLKAIAYTNIAMILMALLDVLSKKEVSHLSITVILFSRSLVMTAATGSYLLLIRRYDLFRTRQFGLLSLRGVMSVLTSGLFFYSLKKLEIASATTITMLSPLLIALISGWLLKEKVGKGRWLAILWGFASVAFILQPGGGLFNEGAFIALLSTVFYALTMILNRKLVEIDNTLTILFYFSLVSTILLIPFSITDFSGLPQYDYVMLAGIGLLSVLAQFFAVGAYRYATAHTVAAFDYVLILYVAIAGYVFLNEKPVTSIYLGALGLSVSGLWVIYQEYAKERSRRSKDV